MTAAAVAMAVGRAVVEIIRVPAGLSSLAPPVVHECAALRTDQLAGQGIGCAGAVRPPANEQGILRQFPAIRRDDGLVRVFKDAPFLAGVLHTLGLETFLG